MLRLRMIRAGIMDGLKVEVKWTGRDTAVITVVGDLEYTTASRLTAAGDALRDRRVAELVIDMTGVGFCDSSGVAALVALWRLVHGHGGTASLVGLHTQLAERLDRFGIARLFEVDGGSPDLVSA